MISTKQQSRQIFDWFFSGDQEDLITIFESEDSDPIEIPFKKFHNWLIENDYVGPTTAQNWSPTMEDFIEYEIDIQFEDLSDKEIENYLNEYIND
jgi:hypothetical protein